MAFRDHIVTCNRYDLSRFQPVFIGAVAVGWVSRALAERLSAYPKVFEMADGGSRVFLSTALTTPAERTAAVANVVRHLVADGVIPRLRNEMFPVVAAFGAPELMRLDRAAVPFFGVRAFGVHLNGFVRTAHGIKMWIAQRSRDKRVSPGKFDNIVAGGQPAGLSLLNNLIKECAEEADMSAEMASRAVPVGAVTYCMESEHGLKPDCMFCYDLELPPDFVPRNTDGEVESFMLCPVEQVIETVRTTDNYKFNVNLVIIDFAFRHGLLSPDDDPEYLDIFFSLHQPLALSTFGSLSIGSRVV